MALSSAIKACQVVHGRVEPRILPGGMPLCCHLRLTELFGKGQLINRPGQFRCGSFWTAETHSSVETQRIYRQESERSQTAADIQNSVPLAGATGCGYLATTFNNYISSTATRPRPLCFPAPGVDGPVELEVWQ